MRRFSPRAELSKAPLLELMRPLLPRAGLVLEVASGTGQQVAHFAAELPELLWQPSEVSPGALDSIASWVSGMENVRAPLSLDVEWTEWPCDRADAVIALNLLHSAPRSVMLGLLRGAARILPAGGPLLVYGALRDPAEEGAAASREQTTAAPDPLAAWTVRIDPPLFSAVERAAEESGVPVERRVETSRPGSYLLVLRRR